LLIHLLEEISHLHITKTTFVKMGDFIGLFLVASYQS